MATLSAKVTTELADSFQIWAEEQGDTASTALRKLVEAAVKCRRFEVHDWEVGPPVGTLYLDMGDA